MKPLSFVLRLVPMLGLLNQLENLLLALACLLKSLVDAVVVLNYLKIMNRHRLKAFFIISHVILV